MRNLLNICLVLSSMALATVTIAEEAPQTSDIEPSALELYLESLGMTPKEIDVALQLAAETQKSGSDPDGQVGGGCKINCNDLR